LFDLNYKFINGSFAFSPDKIYILDSIDKLSSALTIKDSPLSRYQRLNLWEHLSIEKLRGAIKSISWVKTIASDIAAIKRVPNFFPPEKLHLSYKALFQPYLDYNYFIWETVAKKFIIVRYLYLNT